ncbi:MAG: NAD(P)/FAD-dependent oxidoreductase [Spirochaetales bacterium]|nr:NAD(P)/FAD-dependent oxidoreductase [Spirochaetales bacterium]
MGEGVMKHIVILGGGYAGVHAGLVLNKAFKNDKNISITLIDKNPYHTLMTELHEVAGNRVDNDTVRVSYDRIFGNKSVNVVMDRIINLDTEKQELKSETKVYSYDYLIMGVGAEPTDFGIPGVKENSLPLWSYEHALQIKEHIIEKFTAAAHEKEEEKRRKMLTFAVAGAGFTGIEMLGELIEWFPLLCEEYGINKDEYSLINVEGMCQILNMIPEKPRKKAYRYMEKKGVRFILNSFVSEAREGSFTLKDGSIIECETLIWTCGVKGSGQGRDWGLTVAHVDRLKVDATMRTPEHRNIFIVGDGQWFIENERPIPQIVEAAEQTAAVAAKNIIHEITGKGKEVTFKSQFHGFMVSIGGRYGVSHTMGLSLSGVFAMGVKHLINCYYLHTICGVNGWVKYLQHEIFQIKNKRSLFGGMIAGKVQGLWAVPLRMWLGLMWLFEGINKVGEGWLNSAKGTSSSWMFSSGVIQRGMEGYGSNGTEAVSTDDVSAASDAAEVVVETVVEAVSAASDAAVETVAEAVATVHEWKPVWDLSKSVFSWNSGLVTWFREVFMDGMAAHIDFNIFQTMVVSVEVLLGLALLGGLFTFPAAGVSIIMCFVFILSGLFSWSQVWFIFAAFLVLGGTGRTLGLDYWVMPWMKKWWNGTGLAKSTHIYTGEPRFKKRAPRSGKKG